jgi:FtsP/CotA-like multicopper oxidase with cupredoxin domain
MPTRFSRRSMLAGMAALPALALVGCESDRTTADPISTADTLDFGNRLRIPALAASSLAEDGVRVFRLSAVAGAAEFLPGMSTPTWGYTDGSYDTGYLGPTLRAARGEHVRVIVENRLSETTTVHWHGMHLPARYDGGPHRCAGRHHLGERDLQPAPAGHHSAGPASHSERLHRADLPSGIRRRPRVRDHRYGRRFPAFASADSPAAALTRRTRGDRGGTEAWRDLNMMVPLTNGAGGNDHLDLLQLRAGNSLADGGSLPERLEHPSEVALDHVAARRTFQLDGREINGQQMEMSRIDNVVGAGTTELWSVRNTHNQPHNFHVHGVAFQIVPPGATGPDPQLGWKDTVLLAAEETVQLTIKFPPYKDPLTPYMYHCHLMWHEDVGMMAQFTVVNPDQVDFAPRTLQVDHDHMAAGHDHG